MDKCAFSFTCNKKWEQLSPGGYSAVRHCVACDRSVFKCHTRAQHQLGFALNRCVAFTANNEIIGVIGEPEGEWDFLREPTNVISIRKKPGHTVAQTEQLQIYYPGTFTAEALVQLQAGEWLTLGTFVPYVAKALMQELADEEFGIEIQLVDSGNA